MFPPGAGAGQWLVGTNTGDTLTTTNGNIFSIFIWRINGVSQYYIVAAQGGGIAAIGTSTFLTTASASPPYAPPVEAGNAATARDNAHRFSDIINVLDFGADPTGVNDSTTAIQAAINAINSGVAGQRGKVVFPPGAYKVSQPAGANPGDPAIRLPPSATTAPSGNLASIIIEGCGEYGGSPNAATSATGIFASPTFNGFIFDDVLTTGTLAGGRYNTFNGTIWEISHLGIKNSYAPAQIYKIFTAAAMWLGPTVGGGAGASSIQVLTSSLPTSGIQEGCIIFASAATGTFKSGSVSGYISYVAPGGVTAGSPNTNLNLGQVSDVIQGANIPSFGGSDGLLGVQGFFVNGVWSSSVSSGTYNPATGAVSLTLATALSITVGSYVSLSLGGTGSVSSAAGLQIATAGTTGTTLNYTIATGLTMTITSGSVTASSFAMARSAPTGAQALDPGSYYVWDFTRITNGKYLLPNCLGVVTIGTPVGTYPSGWVGNVLTMNNVANSVAIGTNDLLVLSPISGAIRHYSTALGTVSNCRLSGIIGFIADLANIVAVENITTASPAAFFSTIKNCSIIGYLGSQAIGTMGVYVGQSGFIENCDLNGQWIGARMWGVNPTLIGGRQETCCYGIVLGGICHTQVSNIGISGFLIANTETEGSLTAGICNENGAIFSAGLITGLTLTANHQNACYGLFLGAAGGVSITASTISGSVAGVYGGFWNPSFAGNGTPAAIYIADSTDFQAATFTSCVAGNAPGSYNIGLNQATPAWRMPTNAQAARFVNCNNPPPVYTFAKLPATTNMTAQISADGTGTGSNGIVMQLTSGSLPGTLPVGGGIINNTAGGIGPVQAGTVLTSSKVTGLNQKQQVNISQLVPAGTPVKVCAAIEGDEYMISDSSVSYQTTVTVSTPSGPQNITYSNQGAPVTGGGGSNRVKVRWSVTVINPVTGVPGTWVVA
jgi:hypothetical protein